MPIRAEFRHFYGREWREAVRPRILARAGNKCEQCTVPNLKIVERHPKAPGWWFELETGAVHDRAGKIRCHLRGSNWPEGGHFVHIVLTVAHLNHTPGDDRDENLKALCQWCHLNYDQLHHHQTRAARKDAARPLLTPN